jgi:DNA-binding NarL/FixJ family response regulator
MKNKFLKSEWEDFISNCDFTDDELEILPFLRRGWSQVDIAAELCISHSTFKRRLKNINNKITKYILMSN